jgi:hypothetical protein
MSAVFQRALGCRSVCHRLRVRCRHHRPAFVGPWEAEATMPCASRSPSRSELRRWRVRGVAPAMPHRHPAAAPDDMAGPAGAPRGSGDARRFAGATRGRRVGSLWSAENRGKNRRRSLHSRRRLGRFSLDALGVQQVGLSFASGSSGWPSRSSRSRNRSGALESRTALG